MRIKLKNLISNGWHRWISNVSPFALLQSRDESKIWVPSLGSISYTQHLINSTDTYWRWQGDKGIQHGPWTPGIHSLVSLSSSINYNLQIREKWWGHVLPNRDLGEYKTSWMMIARKSHFPLSRNVSAAGSSKGLGLLFSLLSLTPLLTWFPMGLNRSHHCPSGKWNNSATETSSCSSGPWTAPGICLLAETGESS